MSEAELSTSAMRTARLELRILEESCLNDFHAIWNNPAVAKWSTRGTSNTLEESRARMVGLLTNSEKPERINYGVFVRSLSPPPGLSSPLDPKTTATPVYSETNNANHMIGVVGVTSVPSDGEAEVGYIFNQSSWGQGYASEALATYLELYWDRVKTIDAIIAKVDTENIPSIRVLKKCGFEEVEHFVGDIVLPELGRRDTLVFRTQRPGATC